MLTQDPDYQIQPLYWGFGQTDHDYMGNQLSIYAPQDVLVEDPGPDLDLYLFPPDTTDLASGWPVAGSAGEGSAEAFSTPIWESGDYYLVVNSWSGSSEYTLTASKRVTDPDFEIPGVPRAVPFTNTDSLDGYIDAKDVRSFYLKAGERIDVEMSGDVGTDFDMYLYGPDTTTTVGATAPFASSSSYGSQEYISYTARQSGYHYLDIDGRPSPMPGAYTISVTRGINDFDGDMPGTYRALPAHIVDSLDPAIDPNDFWTVYLVKGQVVDATLWYDEGAEIDARLFGPGLSTLSSALVPLPATGTLGVLNGSRRWIAQATGFHHLNASVSPTGIGGGYQLDVSAQAPGVSYPSSVSISTTPSRPRVRRYMSMSGYVTPGGLYDHVTIEYRRVGTRRWSKFVCDTYSLGFNHGTYWTWRYRPRSRGYYQFRVRFNGAPGRAAAVSRTVKVRVR